MNLSIVVPAKDEEKSLPILYGELVSVLRKTGKTYEILFVDDGSSDNSLAILKALKKRDSHIKIISHRGNFGKSIALLSGFNFAKGDVIITLDADLQDDPRELPKFLKKMEEGYDLVSGWKKERHDPLSKTLPSKIGNFLTRILTKIPIHDLNCGFKAYKRNVVESLNLYGEMYKFIPVLAQRQNFRVGEVVIKHRARRFGRSKYGMERNVKGFLDLITVSFLSGYLRKPGHFFGTIGLFLFGSGFIIGIYITYLRITTGTIQYRQPLLFLGILLMIVGVQLITTGLLAELFVNLSPRDRIEGKIRETYL